MKPRTALDIKLVKPPAGEKYFGRAERVILVDGVRWGRTIVEFHGCHGTSTKFSPEGGGVLAEKPNEKHPREYRVRSMNKRHCRINAIVGGNSPVWRPTEELVLEKVRELIAAGKFRHPDIVKEENERRNREVQKRRVEGEAKKNALFDAKAREALGIRPPGFERTGPSMTNGELIDRVVAAMKWAQSQ